MSEKLLHLQRWIQRLWQRDDLWFCGVVYTITESREEIANGTGVTALEAARKAWKAAKAHYQDRRDNYYLKRGYVETDEKFRVFNVYEHESSGHLLAWTRRGWHCKICDCHYEYISGDYLDCPGVKRYRKWDDIPENLKTATQLYELGYSKGKTKLPDAEGAIAWQNRHTYKEEWQWVYLYPVEKAVERKVTKSQEKALNKAHRAKGSTIDIIKAVKKILPPEYKVISEYVPNEDDWYKNYYTLKINLNDLIVYDEYLSKTKKRAIERAKAAAIETHTLNEVYRIAESILDGKYTRFYARKGLYGETIYIYLYWRDEDATRSFETLELAVQNVALALPEMIKELQS